MSESGFPTGTTPNTITMRLIGIPKGRTKREWCGRFVEGPGIVRRLISLHRRGVVVGLLCKRMGPDFAALVVCSE